MSTASIQRAKARTRAAAAAAEASEVIDTPDASAAEVANAEPSTTDPAVVTGQESDPADPATDSGAQPEASTNDGGSEVSPDATGQADRPPLTGAGSSLAAWHEYALSQGKTEADLVDLTRVEIAALLDA